MGFLPSGPEVWVILIIILIVFGAGKLPQVGGALGKGIREFRISQKQAMEEDEEEEGEPEAEEAPAAAEKKPAATSTAEAGATKTPESAAKPAEAAKPTEKETA